MIEKLHESFDSHPEFYLPINGYSMELSNPPQDAQLLHDFVDNLHKQLKGESKYSQITILHEKCYCTCIHCFFSLYGCFH